MKPVPRSHQHNDLYRKYRCQDSEISGLLGECGVKEIAEVFEIRKMKSKVGESFASKYLHFHRPNAFPIMDSFAKKGLKCAGSKNSVNTYEAFCKAMIDYISKLKKPWTLRGIDSNLVLMGKQHDARNCNCVRRKSKSIKPKTS